MERYEQLRSDALGGEGGWRLGLALLERRGVAAWAHAWPGVAPQSASAAGPAVAAVAGGEELVGALATMALACLAGS